MERAIKYENDLNKGLRDEIRRIPGCQRVGDCIQCGTCSATCPVSLYMDYTPRRLLAMVKEGFEKEVLRSQTIWLCSSCYSCTVRCPRQIGITDIMYALKRRAIEKGVYPRRFPIPVLAREFGALVRRHGRSSEARLVMRLATKTNPFAWMTSAGMAWRLWRKGRLPLSPEQIREPGVLRRMLERLAHREDNVA